MSMVEIDFTGSSHITGEGFTRSELQGTFTSPKLAGLLVEVWLPYFECKKCGRWKYCGLADPVYPQRLDPYRNYRCGVARLALSNFLLSAFPSLSKANPKQRNDLLDAAYYFTQYVFRSEVNVGNFLSVGMLNWYGELSHLMASNLKGVRQHLGSFFDRMRGFPEFCLRERMLLVEGQTELRFVERLRSSPNWFPYDLHVATYEGKSNRNSRLTLLIKRYEKDGYDVLVQGDADGQDKTRIHQELCRQHGISTERVFLFDRDFEHAVGKKLLATGITRMLDLSIDYLDSISSDLEARGSIGDVFARYAAGKDFSDHKVGLAECIAEELVPIHWPFADAVFLGKEIVDFVTFVNGRPNLRM